MYTYPQIRTRLPLRDRIIKRRAASHDRCTCHHTVSICVDNGVIYGYMKTEVIGIDNY